MPATPTVQEQTMRVREVLMRAVQREISWIQAADGSLHAWLALRPQERQCRIVVVDDATRRLLYAQLCAHEGTEPVLAAIHAVVSRHGVPQALYTDRARWAAYTPKSGGPVDTVRLEGVCLQVPKQPGRPSCAGLTVTVRRHLDHTHSVWWGPRRLGRFDARGKVLREAAELAA